DERLFSRRARVKTKCQTGGVGMNGNRNRLDTTLPAGKDRSAAGALKATGDGIVFYPGCFDEGPENGQDAVFFLEFAAASRAAENRYEEVAWFRERRRPGAVRQLGAARLQRDFARVLRIELDPRERGKRFVREREQLFWHIGRLS